MSETKAKEQGGKQSEGEKEFNCIFMVERCIARGGVAIVVSRRLWGRAKE